MVRIDSGGHHVLISEIMRPLRIAIVTSIHPDFDFRIWKHAYSLAAVGCHVDLVCPWRVPSSMPPGIRMHPFLRVEHRLLRPCIVPWRVLRNLIPILRSVDLVHFHDLDLLPWMAAVSSIRPTVYDVHENYAEEMLVRAWIPRPLRWPLCGLVRLAHTVLAPLVRNLVLVVPEQEQEFRSARLRKHHLRNYASEGLLKEVRDDYAVRPDTVVFTGSHYDENGSRLLLDIAQELLNRGLSVRIMVTDRFCTDDYRRMFEGQMRSRGLNNIVLLPSIRSDRIMDLLNRATIGLLPDLRARKCMHGISTRLFEYMAAGLPIVTSDIGFQGETVAAEHAGLLAQPESPTTFADAIQQLVKDRILAAELGQRGQAAFRARYTWESQIPSLLDYYRLIVVGKNADAVRLPGRRPM